MYSKYKASATARTKPVSRLYWMKFLKKSPEMRKAKSAMGSFAVGRKYRKAVFKIGSVTTHSKNGRRHNTWRKKLKMKYRRRKKQFLSRNGRRHDEVWQRQILDCKKFTFTNHHWMYLEHTQHTCLSFVMQKLNFVTDLFGRILSLELFIGTGI